MHFNTLESKFDIAEQYTMICLFYANDSFQKEFHTKVILLSVQVIYIEE
jgi:hypothetical protein